MKTGQCKLCLLEKELIKSHIIPRSFWKMMIEPGESTFYQVSTERGVKPKKTGGQRTERLLCGACEKKIKRYEDYMGEVFKSDRECTITRSRDGLKLTDVDYVRFRLFQLSILWKSSVSKQKIYGAVQLGPHEDKLRQMIVNEDPGEPSEYPCLMIGIYLPEEERKAVAALLGQPEKVRVTGVTGYCFIFGSCIWLYPVSKHFDISEAGGSGFVIQRDGTVQIPLRNAPDIPYLRRYFTEISHNMTDDQLEKN